MPLLLSADDFESSLDAVRAAAAGPIEGIFGPESLTWRVDREAAVFLGARAGAVAAVGAPLGRRRHIGAFQNLCRSGRPVSPDLQHHLHDGVRHARSGAGRKPPAASASRRGDGNIAAGGRPLEAGSSYSANEVSALRWVHATLVETALQTHDLVLPALTNSEREQYWAEAKLYAALFGVRPADLPADWTSFTAYTEAMSQSDSLAVSPAARDIAQQIFSGRATGLRVPRWYRALTAHLLPERLARRIRI